MSGLPDFAREYLDCFDRTWSDDAITRDVRFVVLDTETTGLDPRRDRLITIGAVAIVGEEIILADSFEAMLRVAYNNSSVTVHGITREEARDGLDEVEALQLFLPYLRDGVIVGHHIGHDVATINAACERHFGLQIRNRALDTMDLALHLQRDGAFAGAAPFEGFSLDALCTFFDVAPHDRHTAGGDAFMTAIVFLHLLHAARTHGRSELCRLSEPFLVEDEEPASQT